MKPRFVPGLALRVLRQITDYPKTWNQAYWECGTARCVAGHAIAIVYGSVRLNSATEKASNAVCRTCWGWVADLASTLYGVASHDAGPYFDACADPRPWLAGLARRDHLLTCSVGTGWSDRMREVVR